MRIGAAWLGLGALAAGLAGLLPRRTIVEAQDAGHDAGRDADQGDPAPARHEGADIGFRPMLLSGVLMLVGLAGIVSLAGWLYPGTESYRAVDPPDTVNFPAPRLQANPGADMARFRAEQMQQSNGVYWLDRERGRVHMPIADAMRKVAAQGIADWPSTPAWVRR